MGAVDGVLCSARNGQRPTARGENTRGSNYAARQPAAAGGPTTQRASQRRQERVAQRTQYWAAWKRQQRLAAANANIDLLVGSVHETDAQHLMRHADAGFMQNCPRCMVISKRADIAQVAPWASERPCKFGGSWRMGCRICFAGRNIQAAFARKVSRREINKGKEVCQQAIARCSSKLGELQCLLPTRSCWMLTRMLRRHAASDFHRLAASVINCPSQISLSRIAPTTVNKHCERLV